MALALALLLAFALVSPSASDDGAYRSMARGRVVAAQGGFPQSDPFNFSLPSNAGFDKDGWLFFLASYGLHQFAGLKALGLLRSLLLLGSFAFLLGAGFRRGARPFSSALAALWALAALLPFSQYGPSLAGFFFFSGALWLMEGDFWGAFFARWLWLPILLVLWINADSSALLLLPASWIWALGEKGSESAEKPGFPGLALLGTLGTLSACIFLHPSLWRAPLMALPPAPSSPFEAGAFEGSRAGLSLLAAAAVALFSGIALPQGKEHARRDLLLFLAAAIPALLWRPFLPFASLLCAPMLAGRADTVVDSLPSALRSMRWILKFALLGLAFYGLPPLLAKASRPATAAPAPKETLEFFKEELLDGNVYNENGWAGRLCWELSPSLKVFSDGLKGNASDYVRVLEAGEGWEKILDRYSTDYAWLKVNSTLAKAMARSALWQPLDFDDASVLYARVSPAHAALIKTWAPRGLRPGDRDEPFESSRLPQVDADLEMRRLRRPKSGILHYYQARLAVEKGKEALARQWLEQGIKAAPGFGPNYALLGELRMKMGDKKGAQSFYERAAALGGL